MTTRILIADDQADVLSGFRLVLDAQPDMTVVAEARDGEAALRQARELRPDVVVADIRMPRMDGLELTRRLVTADRRDRVRVVVVTTFDHDDDVLEALHAGASGFLLKRAGPVLLVEAIRAAMAGDTLVSPELTLRLLRRWRQPPSTPAPAVLTPREGEVADLVARGRTNAEIATALSISPGTVKSHVAHIADRLGVGNRVGIAAWAWRTGFTTDDDLG